MDGKCSRLGARLVTVLMVAAIGGCASTYYDPLPPKQASSEQLPTVTTKTLEQVYRQLYSQLEACYSPGYHVQPRFERDRGHAWIMLVTGFGLNRYSLVGNRFEVRIDMHHTSSGVVVSVTRREGETPGLEARIARWLDGATACHR